MQLIESAALTKIRRILGLTGQGSPSTVLDDGIVSQVLDVSRVVRRSRSPGVAEGLYYAQFKIQALAGANATGDIDPYDPGDLARAGWPAPVPEGFDVWILQASGTVGNSANFSAAELALLTDAALVGLGTDESGNPFSGSAPTVPLEAWTATQFIGAMPTVAVNKSGGVLSIINRRVARGETIRVGVTAGGGGSTTLTLVCLLAIVPSGLGQDVTA